MTTATTAADLGARAVRMASKVRGQRVFHPRGRSFRAVVRVPGGARVGVPLLDEPGTYDAVVRVSRGAGLPGRFPDVGGLAVRLLDVGGPGRHQDLLVDTAATVPVLRRLPMPGREVLGATFSSLLPYEAAGRRLLVGAAPAGPRRATLDTLTVPWALLLTVASAHGPWRPVARVEAWAELPEEEGRQVRFTPGAAAGGLVPAGPTQEWRRRSYPASHVAPDET